MAGRLPQGPVILFDDDYYYLGGVIAEKLKRDGLEVAIVTPADVVSPWTENMLEMQRIQKRLMELEIELLVKTTVTALRGDHVELACVYSGRRSTRACASLVTLSGRLPNDGLYQELTRDGAALAAAGITSVVAIGDAYAPSTIAAAVYAGHRVARELDAPADDLCRAEVPFRRELPLVGATP
jgi:dimethylamine/trimethylamine dehydrogenase